MSLHYRLHPRVSIGCAIRDDQTPVVLTCSSVNREKLIEYFQNKKMNDFKNSKKFWEFYKSLIKIRSDKSQSKSPNLLLTDNVRTSDPETISNLFNGFFTSIESISSTKNDKCIDFIDNLFNELIKGKPNSNIFVWIFLCENI
jgi:hypothetical protein